MVLAVANSAELYFPAEPFVRIDDILDVAPSDLGPPVAVRVVGQPVALEPRRSVLELNILTFRSQQKGFS
jgi:hypothetical protein